MDAEALDATLATGESTSTRARAVGSGAKARRAATSCGSVDRGRLRRRRAARDVDPVGPTCHRGTRRCFDAEGAPAERDAPGFAWLETLWSTIADAQRSGPEGSYTRACSTAASTPPVAKVTEEATEVLLAAKDDRDGRGVRATPRRRPRRGDRRPAVPRPRAAGRTGSASGRGHRRLPEAPRAARPDEPRVSDPRSATSLALACRPASVPAPPPIGSGDRDCRVPTQLGDPDDASSDGHPPSQARLRERASSRRHPLAVGGASHGRRPPGRDRPARLPRDERRRQRPESQPLEQVRTSNPPSDSRCDAAIELDRVRERGSRSPAAASSPWTRAVMSNASACCAGRASGRARRSASISSIVVPLERR